jgi:pyruvate-formate lyase-activating enzyme
MSLALVEEILEESKKIGTVDHVYFEGGEPFLYYPVLVESLKMAKEKGFDVGLLSNAYWATDTGRPTQRTPSCTWNRSPS